MAVANSSQQVYEILSEQLGPKLSHGASVTLEAPLRWTTFKAPKPVAVVNVHSEEDVAATVQYCISKGLGFLAQNGGSGWADFPDTGELVLINIAGLDKVTVSADEKTVLVEGGAKVEKAIRAADAAGVVILTGNCNCVGVLGAILGGGYGNLLGLYGFGVDNVLEMRVVTADGTLRTVSGSQEKDLFWALRGAGPSFGIVTSAVLKATPLPDKQRTAWFGAVMFTSDKLEDVVSAIDSMKLTPRTNIFMYFVNGGPPSNEPVIMVTLYLFQGTAEEGHAEFKSLYDAGPIVDTTSVLTYTEWNTAANVFCEPGGRKHGYSAGLSRLDPTVWRQVWNEYVVFQKQPGCQNSAVLVELYDLTKAQEVDANSAAFAHRDVKCHAVAFPWYDDSIIDSDAVQFGTKIRDMWRKNSGMREPSTYVNFARGDESLEEIYGKSLDQLRILKRKWDPENRFNQWFNIR